MVPNPMNKWMIWGVFPLFLDTPICKSPRWCFFSNNAENNDFAQRTEAAFKMTRHISWTIHAEDLENSSTHCGKAIQEGSRFAHLFCHESGSPKNCSWSIQGSCFFHFKPLTPASIPKPSGQFYSQKVQGNIQWDLCSTELSKTAVCWPSDTLM